MVKGLLHVVGTGIKVVAHLTAEAKFHIENAGCVLYLAADPATQLHILALNERAESLHRFFIRGQPRYQAYEAIIDCTLESLRKGLNTCLVLYGHPGVFVYPSHEVVQRARAEGFTAVMLPAISAEDCLFADLGLDPGREGIQSFEATDFLIFSHVPNVRTPLILWQVGGIGELNHLGIEGGSRGLDVLTDRLLTFYPPSHLLHLYEASQFAGFDHRLVSCSLQELPQAQPSPFATLVVPACAPCVVDEEMLRKLHMTGPRPRPPVCRMNPPQHQGV